MNILVKNGRILIRSSSSLQEEGSTILGLQKFLTHHILSWLKTIFLTFNCKNWPYQNMSIMWEDNIFLQLNWREVASKHFLELVLAFLLLKILLKSAWLVSMLPTSWRKTTRFRWKDLIQSWHLLKDRDLGKKWSLDLPKDADMSAW